MKYEYYNPSLEIGGCIPRAISKALNVNYSDAKNDLIKLSIKLKKDDYHFRIIKCFLFFLLYKCYNCY